MKREAKIIDRPMDNRTVNLNFKPFLTDVTGLLLLFIPPQFQIKTHISRKMMLNKQWNIYEEQTFHPQHELI